LKFRHLFLAGALAGVWAASSSAEEAGYDCLLQPAAMAEVSTRELGVVQEFLVERGDAVVSGQPVARLESGVEEATVQLMRTRAAMQAEMDEAILEVEFATRRLNRVLELYQTKAVSFDERDTAQTTARRAELKLQQVEHQQAVLELELLQAERRLALRTVRSPLDGVVVKRLLSAGESVEDRAIAEIAQLDPLHAEVIIPQSAYGSIQPGDVAAVTPWLPDGEPISARVTVVDRVIDAASNTFGVRLELPNPGNRVPAGVRCDVNFEIRQSGE
jgi:RND family efflux transporter MFP subunit